MIESLSVHALNPAPWGERRELIGFGEYGRSTR